MLEKLKEIEERYHELSSLLADSETLGNPAQYSAVAKEHASLEELVSTCVKLRQVETELAENELLLEDADSDIVAMAKEELPLLREQKAALEEELRIQLLPKDPNDSRDIILEIRAGTGGEEAALFAANLFRMYTRYAEGQGFKVDILDMNETGIGGFREIIANIQGQGAYSRFKFESGTHRVQRVPETESGGRIHTSAVTVAVLPEVDEVELDIDPNELRIDTYRASGAGGQHVNRTESAIRITHIPSGLVVTCQDEKSQHKNKAQAMKVLRSRLLQMKIDEQNSAIASERKAMVGSGDRSERIRTYNFPQGRITDHRINFTLHKLDQVLEGDLTELIDALTTHYQTEALKESDA